MFGMARKRRLGIIHLCERTCYGKDPRIFYISMEITQYNYEVNMDFENRNTYKERSHEAMGYFGTKILVFLMADLFSIHEWIYNMSLLRLLA